MPRTRKPKPTDVPDTILDQFAPVLTDGPPASASGRRSDHSMPRDPTRSWAIDFQNDFNHDDPSIQLKTHSAHRTAAA